MTSETWGAEAYIHNLYIGYTTDANITNTRNKRDLKPLDIFLDAILVKILSKKYKPIKINTVKIIIFIYFL